MATQPASPKTPTTTTTIPTASTGAPSTTAGGDPLTAGLGGTNDAIDKKHADFIASLRTGGALDSEMLASQQVNVGNGTINPDGTVTGNFSMGAITNPTSTSYGQRNVGQLLDDLQSMDDQTYVALQQKLVNSGYAPKGGLDIGNRFDAKTRQAYGALLADGIAYPNATLDQLTQQKASATGSSAATGGANVYVNQLTDSTQIRSIADQVAQKLLGRDATPEEKARYVDVVHAHENASQDKANSAQEAGQQALHAANGGTEGFESFVNGIIKTESGNPKAIGLTTNLGTATGKYQVLDSTWAGYGGYARAADAPESVQDDFARAKLKGYYDQFGAAGAAVAWYAGPAQAQAYVNDPSNPKWDIKQSAGGQTNNMPSIRDYIGRAGANSGAASTPDGGYLPATTVEQEQVDPSTQLEDQVRKDNPIEASSHDLGNQWQAFSQLIGAPRTVA